MKWLTEMHVVLRNNNVISSTHTLYVLVLYISEDLSLSYMNLRVTSFAVTAV